MVQSFVGPLPKANSKPGNYMTRGVTIKFVGKTGLNTKEIVKGNHGLMDSKLL